MKKLLFITDKTLSRRFAMARIACSFAPIFSMFVMASFLVGCNTTQWVSFRTAKIDTGGLYGNSVINGLLTKPEGHGPFPAVLLLHGCNGQLDVDLSDWPARLAKWGYVSLAVDSFGSRDVSTNCGWHTISDYRLVADAYGAIEYLVAQPFVDARNIGAIGFSMGGTTVLEFAQEDWANSQDTRNKRKLKAGVAMYPRCGRADRVNPMLVAPVQIIIGDVDDWTPAYECENFREGVSPKGAPLSLKILPGAYHAFDVFTVEGRPVGSRVIMGHVLEPNDEANEQAVATVRAFLMQNLGR